MTHLPTVATLMRQAVDTGDGDATQQAAREMRSLDHSLDEYLAAAGLSWSEWSAALQVERRRAA